VKTPGRCGFDWTAISLSSFLFCVLYVSGCGPKLSTAEQVEEFTGAGLIPSAIVGPNGFGGIGDRAGPYRVVPGDLLELHMPPILRIVTSGLSDSLGVDLTQRVQPYLSRVSESGNITIPIVGQIYVAGKTLAEIESTIVDAYYPKYVVHPPMVACDVAKYQSESKRVFTVMGLVNRPAAFPYPPEARYNLMEALAFAGGLDMVADPRYLKIYRQGSTGQIVSATFGVDQGSLNEAYSVMIKPGDVIYVDHTLRTRINQFLADVLQIRVGADVRRTSVD
jgi:protein involved in polysaccharide export with SLBB domain